MMYRIDRIVFRRACMLVLLVGPMMLGTTYAASTDLAEAKAAFDEANAAKNPQHPGYARAYEIWSDLAASGNEQAKYHLGILHLYGLGGAVFDHIQGYDLIKASASGGYPQAQAYVGVMYEKGNGLHFRKGDTEARSWYEKAAASGNCYAVRRLARAHAKGELGFVPDTDASNSYRTERPGCFNS